MKACRLCQEVQPFDAFYAQVGMRDGYRNECKRCFQAAAKARRDADPDLRAAAVKRAQQWRDENIDRHRASQRKRRERPEVKERDREGHLLRKYGMTLADYERLLDSQGGVCGICFDPPPAGVSFHVDHDHHTGRVRALLCVRCNNALGQLNEDPMLVEMAAEYLWRHTIRHRALALRV